MEAIEAGLLDSLDDLGYERPSLPDPELVEQYRAGKDSQEFRHLCFWITQELKFVSDVQESIHEESLNHQDSFNMELSAFAREIGYQDEIKPGELSLLFIQHICSELMCGRILLAKDPTRLAKMGDVASRANENVQCLVNIMKALGISPPPKGITSAQLFSAIQHKLAGRIKSVPPNLVSNRAIKTQLGPIHFQQLDEINALLTREYSIRRQMILKRLDCTIESFTWTDRMKGHTEAIRKAFEPKRVNLSAESTVGIAHLLAARDDVLRYYKTSSSVLRKNTKSKLNEVKMGSVPDRGGRPQETAPPPEEMPAFKKREEPLPSARGGYRGGGGGRGAGGRVQDRNWQGDNANRSGGYQQNYHQQNYNQQSYGNSCDNYGYSSQGGYNNRGGYHNQGGGYHNNQGEYHSNRPHSGRGGGRGGRY